MDFLTTQMFFDNSILYNFLYRIREAGVTVPVLPGIMPVTNKKQMKRICDMSGTVLPQRFLDVLDRFRGRSGGHAAGGNRLRHRPDHRPFRQRHQSCPCVFHEQAGGGCGYHEQSVCHREALGAAGTWITGRRKRSAIWDTAGIPGRKGRWN